MEAGTAHHALDHRWHSTADKSADLAASARMLRWVQSRRKFP
ncbi:hypothetical protein L842_1816 [Mycobacterium intracellulare MIN_052511_1280]|nr:hypothetical protein L842_1816 [Mycobacterium intracellulare MIN_052511_1280]